MLFGEKFKHTYALTDSGVVIARRGTFWTVVVNLIDMGGIMFLYLLMKQLMDHLSGEGDLPGIVPYAAGSSRSWPYRSSRTSSSTAQPTAASTERWRRSACRSPSACVASLFRSSAVMSLPI